MKLTNKNFCFKYIALSAAIAGLLAGGAGSVVASERGPDAENMDFSAILGMHKTMVETHVVVTWDDGTPVVGAKVFDHRRNDLLGVTDASGKLTLDVLNGTLLRLVEPNYGQQQSLRLVQGKKKNEAELQNTSSLSPYSLVMAEGWTL